MAAQSGGIIRWFQTGASLLGMDHVGAFPISLFFGGGRVQMPWWLVGTTESGSSLGSFLDAILSHDGTAQLILGPVVHGVSRGKEQRAYKTDTSWN